MGRIIVIEINFNNYGLNPNRLTREWISERLGIFRRFTLKSLEAQTNQQFLAVVKLAGGCSDIVEEELAKYPPLPANIRFGTTAESNRNIASWVQEVRQVQQNQQNPGRRQVPDLFMARIDSDDLYHKTFVQQLHNYSPRPGTVVLINQLGYVWDAGLKQMAPISYLSPPFYVFLYDADAYLSGERISIPGKGHGNVIKLPHELLKVRNYVNVIHSSNTTVKKVPLKDRLSAEEMKLTLSGFMTKVELS